MYCMTKLFIVKWPGWALPCLANIEALEHGEITRRPSNFDSRTWKSHLKDKMVLNNINLWFKIVPQLCNILFWPSMIDFFFNTRILAIKKARKHILEIFGQLEVNFFVSGLLSYLFRVEMFGILY